MIPQAILATAIALLPPAGAPCPTHHPMPASGVVASRYPVAYRRTGTGWYRRMRRWNCLTMGNRRCG